MNVIGKLYARSCTCYVIVRSAKDISNQTSAIVNYRATELRKLQL